MKATIIDNELYCSLCGSELMDTNIEHKHVEYKGEFYTEFTRCCSRKGCRGVMNYLLDLRVDSTIRFVADEKELKEVKDDKEELSE